MKSGQTQVTLGERLRLAIHALGMTQKEAARICDVPYRTLQNYVRGQREPAAQWLAQVCTHLGISADWLLTGQGEMRRAAPDLTSGRPLRDQDADLARHVKENASGYGVSPGPTDNLYRQAAEGVLGTLDEAGARLPAAQILELIGYAHDHDLDADAVARLVRVILLGESGQANGGSGGNGGNGSGGGS